MTITDRPIGRARHVHAHRPAHASSSRCSPTCCSRRNTTCAPAAASRSRCARSSRRSSELGVASPRRSRSPGIGCYTTFTGTMDVDLVQALHGRAPSVATGVKRMLPDAVVFTLAGRRRHGERRTAGSAAHRGARRAGHVHPPEQRRVRRDRRPHDRDERASASARRTRSTAATPSTTATRSSSATSSRASRARRTSRAVRCTTRARSRARRRCSRRVRDRRCAAPASRSSRCSRCARPVGSSPPPTAPATCRRRSARCTSWASSRSTAASAPPRSCHAENVAKQREMRRPLARGGLDTTRTSRPWISRTRRKRRRSAPSSAPGSTPTSRPTCAPAAGRSLELERRHARAAPRVEPHARRRALRRDRVARGVGRARRGRDGAGRVRRGDAPRRSARARSTRSACRTSRRRSSSTAPTSRSAPAPPHAARRRHLVPGLLRAERRLRPRVAAHVRGARRRRLDRERAEDVEHARPPGRTGASCSCAPTRRSRSTRASRACSST